MRCVVFREYPGLRSCYPPAVTGSFAGLFNGSIYDREALRGWPAVIGWWERRRFFYNKILAVAGTVTCILMISCGLISNKLTSEPIGIPDPPILVPLGIIAYGIMANVCYTGGWITELLLAHFRPQTRTDLFGLRAFRLGVKFSIALTILPALLCWAVFLLSLVAGNRIAQDASQQRCSRNYLHPADLRGAVAGCPRLANSVIDFGCANSVQSWL